MSSSLAPAPSAFIGIPTQRPTSRWLETLKKRAEQMYDEHLDLSKPVEFEFEEERLALKNRPHARSSRSSRATSPSTSRSTSTSSARS